MTTLLFGSCVECVGVGQKRFCTKLLKPVNDLAYILGPNVSGIPCFSEVELYRHQVALPKISAGFISSNRFTTLPSTFPVCRQISHENGGRQELITSRFCG